MQLTVPGAKLLVFKEKRVVEQCQRIEDIEIGLDLYQLRQLSAKSNQLPIWPRSKRPSSADLVVP